jgi:hypothetical protein
MVARNFGFPRRECCALQLQSVTREDRQGWMITGLATGLGPRNQIRSSPREVCLRQE